MLKQPTNPDSAAESSASSTTHLDNVILPAHNLQSGLIASSNGALTPAVSTMAQPTMLGVGYGADPNFDFFDANHWMLDTLMDFNYGNYVQPLEGA